MYFMVTRANQAVNDFLDSTSAAPLDEEKERYDKRQAKH